MWLHRSSCLFVLAITNIKSSWVSAMVVDHEKSESLFKKFLQANTFTAIRESFELLCHSLEIDTKEYGTVYKQLKTGIRTREALCLWNLLDKRAEQKIYENGKVCSQQKVWMVTRRISDLQLDRTTLFELIITCSFKNQLPVAIKFHVVLIVSLVLTFLGKWKQNRSILQKRFIYASQIILSVFKCQVFIIGAGPCGLRLAIEGRLLGSKVVMVEMRNYITRNNILHLWPSVIDDLKFIGAKIIYRKFCTGSVNHISEYFQSQIKS